MTRTDLDTATESLFNPRYEVARALNAGLDLDRRRNQIQAPAVVVSALVGAIVGYWVVTEVPLVGAVYGLVAGMVLGTFFSGLALMRAMPRPKEVSFGECLPDRRQAAGIRPAIRHAGSIPN